MKNKFKFLEAMRGIAIIAIVAMIGFTMIACEDETVTPDGALIYTLDSEADGYIVGATLYTTHKSLQGAVTIPAEYSGKPVIGIDERGFYNHSGITSVSIPASVTYLDDLAFWGCSGLTTVTFGASSLLESIGDSAFSGCTSLTSITIPSIVKSIGASAFSNTKITSITIPSGVTSIGNNTFYNCTSLTSIILSSNLETIGQYAFRSCTSVTEITIPSGVEKVDSYAFYGWTDAQTINIIGKASKYATTQAGWSSSWDSSCTADIVYNYQP